MREKYLSVDGLCVTEKVIERSRFITASRHVEDEAEARAFIAEREKKYADATHHCYAYIADELGNLLRFSDDGEPQGTAGMPMLDVLKNRNLVRTAVVVTRYFGGIKLGAGGLVRAYAGCVAENLDRAKKVSYELCAESLYTVDYSSADAAARYFGDGECNVISVEYADKVSYLVAVKKELEGPFNRSLVNFFNGKVVAEKRREYYFPFEVSP